MVLVKDSVALSRSDGVIGWDMVLVIEDRVVLVMIRVMAIDEGLGYIYIPVRTSNCEYRVNMCPYWRRFVLYCLVLNDGNFDDTDGGQATPISVLVTSYARSVAMQRWNCRQWRGCSASHDVS